MPLSPLQVVHVTYTVTAQDIINGYISVPCVWPAPFSDTDYTYAWDVEDLDPLIDLSYAHGDTHDITIEGITPVVFLAAATPYIQGQADIVDSTAPTTPIAITAPRTSMYQVTLYYGPARSDAADAGKSWSPTITWEDPAGNMLQASSSGPTIVLGDAEGGLAPSFGVDYMQSYSLPFFVMAGTPLTVTGAYTGGSFPMNISIRVVEMPSNNTITQPGDQFTIHAMALHN